MRTPPGGGGLPCELSDMAVSDDASCLVAISVVIAPFGIGEPLFRRFISVNVRDSVRSFYFLLPHYGLTVTGTRSGAGA